MKSQQSSLRRWYQPLVGCFLVLAAIGSTIGDSPRTAVAGVADVPAVGGDVSAPLRDVEPIAGRAGLRPAERLALAVGDGQRFETLPPGSALPSGDQCAALVRSAVEVRQVNSGENSRRGTRSNSTYPRVDGDFVGTTDEILQWAACKWGIDEDLVRAQAAKESWWKQSAGGDLTSDQSACHPSVRTANGTPCPESIGLLQVRFAYHGSAFVDANAIQSTAYNADYAYAWWRDCFEGRFTWLNDVEHGATYRGGDARGCLGVWFAGRWYTDPAREYLAAVDDYLSQRVWEQPSFIAG